MMKDRAMIQLLRCSYCAIALVLLALLFWPEARAVACACCSETGTWFERTDRLSDYQRAEINRLRFDTTAKTFLTEAGEDAIKGISNVADDYALSLSKGRRSWELKFRDKQGRTGTLTLTVPATIVEFGADLHDDQKSSGGGPLLYKELRLTGSVSGAGLFMKGSTPQTKFRLILQGRGNSCLSAEDFKSWTLQVFGPRASYSFYGSFKDPAPQPQG